jgi:hypothetical protein
LFKSSKDSNKHTRQGALGALEMEFEVKFVELKQISRKTFLM